MNRNIKHNSTDTELVKDKVEGLTVSKQFQEKIYDRIGFITINRLYGAALKIYMIEKDTNFSNINEYLPNLENMENNQIFKDACQIIFFHSKEGDTIQEMAIKVLVLIAVVCDPTVIVSHLDINMIMATINSVVSQYNYDQIPQIFNFTINRMKSLNEAAKSRPPIPVPAPDPILPMEEVDGGFYKKNYRKSIKKRKSMKLRRRQ
jgi:hypothetical protein